jgi:hypothetical protein
VVAFVLSLLLMIALGVIVPALKVTHDAEQSTVSQREVVLALDRLSAEMSVMDRATVTTAPGCFSFLSSRPYGGSNAALADPSLDMFGLTSPHDTWRKHVFLRLRDGQVFRREFPYAKGAALSRVVPAQLHVLADQLGVAEKTFAKNIEAFEATEVGSSRLVLQIRSVQREAAKPTACEVTLQIQMRGGV